MDRLKLILCSILAAAVACVLIPTRSNIVRLRTGGDSGGSEYSGAPFMFLDGHRPVEQKGVALDLVDRAQMWDHYSFKADFDAIVSEAEQELAPLGYRRMHIGDAPWLEGAVVVVLHKSDNKAVRFEKDAHTTDLNPVGLATKTVRKKGWVTVSLNGID